MDECESLSPDYQRRKDNWIAKYVFSRVLRNLQIVTFDQRTNGLREWRREASIQHKLPGLGNLTFLVKASG